MASEEHPRVGTILDHPQAPDFAWRAQSTEVTGAVVTVTVSQAAAYGYGLTPNNASGLIRKPELELPDVSSGDELFPALNIVVTDRNEHAAAGVELFGDADPDGSTDGIFIDPTQPDSIHMLTSFPMTVGDPLDHRVALLQELGYKDQAEMLRLGKMGLGSFIASKLAEEAAQVVVASFQFRNPDYGRNDVPEPVEAYGLLAAHAVRRLVG